MGETLAQAVAFGLAVALSPFPIIGIVLILAAPGGRSRGLAFLGGALAGVGAAGALILALESRAGPTDGADPANWVSVVK
ncbi:MAG: GAP family protein, partial [Thermoleophilia bacterium]|nr:GAP family protein [Thermoleophilia bacterium]